MTVQCLPRLYLSQTHRVTLEKPPLLFIISTSIFKKKVWVFLFLLYISCYLPWFSWFVSFYWVLCYLGFWTWVWLFLLSLNEWVLLIMLLRCYILVLSWLNFSIEYVYWSIMFWACHTHCDLSYCHMYIFFGDFLVIHSDGEYGWVTMFIYYMIGLCVGLCTLGDSCWVSILTVTVLCFKIGVKMHCVLLNWVISWHVDLELCMNWMFGMMLCLSLCH